MSEVFQTEDRLNWNKICIESNVYCVPQMFLLDPIYQTDCPLPVQQKPFH